MGEVQSTSPYLHRPQLTVPPTPCLDRGFVKRLFPVDTGSQLISDFTESYGMPCFLW